MDRDLPAPDSIVQVFKEKRGWIGIASAQDGGQNFNSSPGPREMVRPNPCHFRIIVQAAAAERKFSVPASRGTRWTLLLARSYPGKYFGKPQT